MNSSTATWNRAATSSVGPPRPLGERGAYVADHVAGSPSDPA
jgi:hypothetical protein